MQASRYKCRVWKGDERKDRGGWRGRAMGRRSSRGKIQAGFRQGSEPASAVGAVLGSAATDTSIQGKWAAVRLRA